PLAAAACGLPPCVAALLPPSPQPAHAAVGLLAPLQGCRAWQTDPRFAIAGTNALAAQGIAAAKHHACCRAARAIRRPPRSVTRETVTKRPHKRGAAP